jgi:predicted MPP superfamily phosphohydrolase
MYRHVSGFKRFLLANLWVALSALLGLMQAVIAHWAVVVLLGWPLLSPGLCAVAALLFVGANLAMLPVVRRARLGGGSLRRIARVYMAGGGALVMVGGGVGASWLLLLPPAYWLTGWTFEAIATGDSFRAGSVAFVAIVVTTIFWGFTVGRLRVQRCVVPVVLDGLEPALRGLRIVQISDLHIGNGLEGAGLESLVHRVNELEPDLVALTGDLFDFDPSALEGGARALGALRARLGVFAVLGNHDLYAGAERVAGALAAFAPKLVLLRGSMERLATKTPLYLAGIDDPGEDWTARGIHLESLERIASPLPDDGPTLLLAHRPDVFTQAERLGFDLVISGHTHGGQIALPGWLGHLSLAAMMSDYGRGLYRRGASQLYVNRGAGFAGPPIRLNAAREITILELR